MREKYNWTQLGIQGLLIIIGRLLENDCLNFKWL